MRANSMINPRDAAFGGRRPAYWITAPASASPVGGEKRRKLCVHSVAERHKAVRPRYYLHRGAIAMAVQSDFRIIAVNEYIGTDPSALNTDFPFVGENSSVKHF